jgi:hypothetical protein
MDVLMGLVAVVAFTEGPELGAALVMQSLVAAVFLLGDHGWSGVRALPHRDVHLAVLLV